MDGDDAGILEKYGNSLWKVTKMKYLVNFMLCNFCQVYNRVYAPKVIDGRVIYTFSMCPKCVKANCDWQTVHYYTSFPRDQSSSS